MFLMGLWAHLCCFGTFAVGFDPNRTQEFAIFLFFIFMGLWALWAHLLLNRCIRLCFMTSPIAFIWNLGQQLRTSGWSKFVGPKLESLL